ncbi:methyl-accepting chemotaxis protein [Dickeya chrysanthemi]|uniref:methyl-accepting chemotaxis protein n=1 Tax=Dickeya chrysanthemi TaxID=556 RepID=UPI0003A6040C|nr:methyl-accepting chemotaxis protein [Dickeya chrysanthemi]MBX9447168.1 MCP four helix bundle domain-containing protein [Dickeya chrysanthemi]MCA7007799.1 methyl-accepting chemotaxis protein [Dickeya chrysanthemi]
MNALKKMKLGTMLSAGFALVIVIGLLVATFGRTQLVGLGDDIDHLSATTLTNMMLIQEAKTGFDTNSRLVRNIALSNDTSRIASEKQQIDRQIARNTEVLKQLSERLDTPETRDQLNQLTLARPAYLQAFNKAVALGMSDQPEQRNQARELILNDMQTAQNGVFKALDNMLDFQKKVTMSVVSESMHNARADGTVMLALALAAAVLGALTAWLITRTVKGQLGGEPAYAAAVAQQISDGNLAFRVELRDGDTKSVLAAMNDMREKLGQIVTQVRQSSESIATGASEIAAGSTDLSQRTEEQAASLQQTAASMEQMSQTIRQNGDTVRTATTLAQSASSTAAKGGEAVGNIVRTMEDISASSYKIGDIISVIDGIAFQTNILALNAAVEAARAGEQGRGFAVVAGEVRNLAQRSASAAKEIKELITASVEKVEMGSAQVSEAGSTIDELVKQARHVADLIGEIGVTTHEQESGISQINDAVNQLDQVTQQNAALVEESASAADSLSDQAAKLVELMSVFTTQHTVNHQPPTLQRPGIAPKKSMPSRLALANDAGSSNWEQF